MNLPFSNKHECVGVSVTTMKNNYYLRLHLRQHHLTSIGNPKRVNLRGNPANGFILAPDKTTGYKPYSTGGNVIYIQSALSNYELSKRLRKQALLRPLVENGYLRLPPLPKSWLDADPEFDPAQPLEEGSRVMNLGSRSTDDAVRISSESRLIANGAAVTLNPTSFVPKSGGPVYRVPDDANMAHLQAELGARLTEAKEIIRVMTEKTGLKMGLDRHMRLVVLL